MESEILPTNTEKTASTQPESSSGGKGEFKPGSIAIYGLHGKCLVTAIETRTVGGKSLKFYKLEIQKSALSRSTRPEPAIWLPVDSARETGLRNPLTTGEVEGIMQILGNREYYFSLEESFHAVQPKLETTVRLLGAVGLAQVVSYLYVLKKRQVVPASEVVKMDALVTKLLYREISEVTGELPKAIEEKTNKLLRHKLLPDH